MASSATVKVSFFGKSKTMDQMLALNWFYLFRLRRFMLSIYWVGTIGTFLLYFSAVLVSFGRWWLHQGCFGKFK